MSKARIMIVEDDATLLHSLTFTLKRKGYEVLAHADPMEALKALRASVDTPPDLLITDLQLPTLDGTGLIRTVRAIGLKRVPVLVITAYGTNEARRELERLGALGILDKPFSGEELVRQVTGILEREEEEPPKEPTRSRKSSQS